LACVLFGSEKYETRPLPASCEAGLVRKVIALRAALPADQHQLLSLTQQPPFIEYVILTTSPYRLSRDIIEHELSILAA
jgi:hypothetical protein